MSKPHAIVIATKNRGKLAELRALLSDLDVEVHAMDDVVRRDLMIVEDGETFADNALKKARIVAAATTMLTVADDSGLEVDALGGAPGVRSARYAGERATDAENNAALLAALEAIPPTERAADHPARFRCVLALIDPFFEDGAPHTVEGVCEGTITRTPRGSGGFGYDPLFLVAGQEKTMAELGETEKNTISHRARAWQKLRLVLEKRLAERDGGVRKILG